MSIEQKTRNFVCSFHVRDLASSLGAYKVISYSWGDPEYSHRVLCSNGQSLHATQSAADILNFVVARNPTEFFWIDQLNINQQDLVEKSEQVRQMGKISSSTKQVVAWLGRGARRDESAFAFVKTLFGDVKDIERKGLLPGYTLCIVIGGSTPFLLRADLDRANSDGTAEKRRKLVGDCFVHSLLYGEGLCMGEPEDVFIT